MVDIKRSSKESGTSESTRLYSAAPGAFREAKTDITYEGFTIPKGWKVPLN